MSVIQSGDTVDLYYYGESNSVRSVHGQVDERDQHSVTIITLSGQMQEFPFSSVQRMILIDANDARK